MVEDDDEDNESIAASSRPRSPESSSKLLHKSKLSSTRLSDQDTVQISEQFSELMYNI